MDIYRLKEDITFAEQIGATLDVAERLKLELSLFKVTQLSNSDELLFWGRVETLSKPYYIALAVDYKGYYEFPHKRFFWGQIDTDFAEMPPLLEQHKDKINSINLMPLTGNPAHIIVNLVSSEENQEDKKEGQEQPVEQDSDEEKENKVEPKNLTQLDRLSVIVRAIQNQCHAVPIGAHRINEQHELRQNIGFAGLTLEGSKQLKNYHLFRSPQTVEKKQLISQADSIFKTNFLDPLDGSKLWSIQSDCSKRDVTLRNLIWPGYVSYHRAQTSVFGSIYIGDGIKKVDLAFFL